MKTFATADWHLGEDRFAIMARPFTSPQQMIDVLVKNHNSLVSPEDTVYMIGDVCYKIHPEYLDQVSRFNGKKILFRGNHDVGISNEEFSKYFETIIPEGEGIYLDIDNIHCYLTHYPTQGVEDAFNLVGHIHSAWKYQLNMFNVGVDSNHFLPVPLDDVSKHLKAITEFYDDDVWVAYIEANSKYHDSRGPKRRYFNPAS